MTHPTRTEKRLAMARPEHVPAELVVDFDAYEDLTIEEQLAKVEQFRKVGPVVWTDRNGGHWVVLSISGARTVLSDAATFSSAKPGQGVALSVVERELHVPIEMDGLDHRQFRKILIPLFSPQRVSILETTVRELARDLLSGFVARGTCEAVLDYARPLASAMFMKLMDWPLQDRFELERLTDQELNGPPDATTAEERAAGKQQAIIELDRYAMARLAERRDASEDSADMTTVIMNSTLADGSPIPERQLVALLRLLSIAGLDTTQSVLSQSLAYLGTHPEAQDYVRQNRAEIPHVVEEFLRWNAPAMPSRSATADAVVDGVRIAAGDTVHLLLAASNRDGQEFENALMIDFTRAVNRHVAFAAGPHKCIGAALARVILAAALDEFHHAIGSYTVLEADSHVGLVWGVNKLVLEVKPAHAGV
jgi:cytochrome P450